MKKRSKKESDDSDSDSNQQNSNTKGKKWWLLNQSKNARYNLSTHWKVDGKKDKTKSKSYSDDEKSSKKISKRKQKSPFDPPSNNSYQMITVCNNSKRKNININKYSDSDDDKPVIKRKNKDYLFSKTKKPKEIEEDSESESIDNNYIEIPNQIEKKSRTSSSIQMEKPPERKIKIDFLESDSSEDSNKGKKTVHKRQCISIDKEEICSFYHLSDYRIPNHNIFNNSAKPLNLQIIENPSHPKFNEELFDAEIRLFPNQFDQFFEIVSNHLRTNSNDVKLCMKLLITVDSVLYYDQAFESLTKSSIFDFLPFSTPKLAILSFKILKLMFMFRPSFFQENYIKTMKHLIFIFPVEMTLSLFIIYAHSFEFIENPWPLLDLLIKEKGKLFKKYSKEDDEKELNKLKLRKYFKKDPDVEADFFVDDTDESFLSLLYFLNSNFDFYKQYRLKYCRSTFIESLFDQTISKKAALTAYKAVISLFDSEFAEKISISNLFNDLKDTEFEDYALQILVKMNVDSIPIKNKYVLQLINSSHANENASLILQKMMSNSQRNEKIAAILLNNSKWLKFGLPTFSHTLMIFQSCVKFGNNSLLNDVKYCEELPSFFTELLKSDNFNDIQQISPIIQDIGFDDFKSLSDIYFFDLLLDRISSIKDDDDVLPFIKLLSDLAAIRYSHDFKKFISTLKKFLKKENNKVFRAALKAMANLSIYKKCAKQIQDQNIVSLAEKNCQSQSDIKILKKIQSNIK